MSERAEFIETAELRDLHDAAPAALRRSLGLQTLERGSMLASIAAKLPASAFVINRAIGLGMDAPATRDTARELVSAYRDAGVERYLIQRHPDAGPPEMVDWLLEAGLEKARGWQKFVRSREPVTKVDTDLTVRQVGPEHGEAFGRIVCDAFDLGEAAVPWVAAIAGRPGWHTFMSFDGDEPAGTGALYVADDCGWTDFGSTAPKFRKRGGQGAVMAARIAHALELGCHTLYTCTGEAVPGDPQHSYSNILKAGFRELYVKENYGPPVRRA